MQGDNGVSPQVSSSYYAAWSSMFASELITLIKTHYRTQVGFVDHINRPPDHLSAGEKHEKYPRLSKQQLSKRLKKPKPDWPLAEMIIKCCTHNDEAATTRELARLAGVYQAATGTPPKGYSGPCTEPSTLPLAAGGEPDDAVILRFEQDLSARDREVDLLTQQLRTTSAAQLRAEAKLPRMRTRIEQLGVQLSEITALYRDQAARAEASESRLRILWERYALLNASRETSARHPVLELGAMAMHRPGLDRRIDPTAPAPRRVLAVYLNSYREFAERPLGVISGASRIDEERLTAIFLAETTPTLEEALAIAGAVAATEATVRRLHATITDDTWPQRPVAAETIADFTEIVASMDAVTDPATVADGEDVLATPTGPARVAVATGSPMATVAPAGTWGPSPAATGTATVAGDRSPVTSRGRSRRRMLLLTTGLATAGTVAAWTVLAIVLLHRTTMSTSEAVALSGCAAAGVVAVLAGAGRGVWWTARRIARQFYRGRHTRRRGDNQPTRPMNAAGPEPARTAEAGDAEPADAADDTEPRHGGTHPSLPFRFMPRVASDVRNQNTDVRLTRLDGHPYGVVPAQVSPAGYPGTWHGPDTSVGIFSHGLTEGPPSGNLDQLM